jgi:biotin transporter BioY
VANAAAPPRPLVLADLLPGQRVRDVLLVTGAAAFVGLAAQLSFHVPGTPVPVTGQTFAVLLAGAALGTWRAFAALALYVVAGAAGLPWYAAHGSGWGGASFGYLLGFVVAATAVGAVAARGGDRTPLRTAATMAGGTLLVYAVGVPWLAATLHIGLGRALALGARPFLVGDAVKVLLAAGLLPAAWRVAR